MILDGSGEMSESMLVIEDDETFSATLVRALKRRGYAVVAARSAAEAFELAPRRACPTRWCWTSISTAIPG
jgi:ActR/RegA family two-component response regulator